MIQELLGGAAMDGQLKSGMNPASLPMLLHPSVVSNPSPTSSSSTSSRSSAQQRSTSATSSPQGHGQTQQPGPQQGSVEQQQTAPLRCPRCNSSNTKFCYYNNYNLTQPRHFCKTCRRYWTKGGALRNVPIGGGCRKPRPMPLPVAKPASPAVSSCGIKAGAPSLGLGFGAMGLGAAGGGPWVSSQQAAAAQLMALLNSARAGGGVVHQGGGGNMHRLLGLDAMAHHGHLPLHVLHGAGIAGGGTAAPPSLWPPQQAAPPRAMATPPPPQQQHMDSSHQLGMGPALGQHDVLLSSLGLKLPPPSSSSSPAAASCYYSDQLHAVVSSAAAATTSQLPCTTALMTSLPPAATSVCAATVGMDLPPVSSSLPVSEMQYWAAAAGAMSMAAWPELPTPNGAFP